MKAQLLSFCLRRQFSAIDALHRGKNLYAAESDIILRIPSVPCIPQSMEKDEPIKPKLSRQEMRNGSTMGVHTRTSAEQQRGRGQRGRSSWRKSGRENKDHWGWLVHDWTDLMMCTLYRGSLVSKTRCRLSWLDKVWWTNVKKGHPVAGISVVLSEKRGTSWTFAHVLPRFEVYQYHSRS